MIEESEIKQSYEEIELIPKKGHVVLKNYLLMLCLGFVMYAIAALPIIIHHNGLFFYYGDYNVQQVPFYVLAHRAVRNGQFFWNFNLDLGGDLVADLSFYLMGSPFFWITIPFPEHFLAYMMPFLMALKYGVATANGYLYFRNNSRTNKGAKIGALLFAFCGFNACNIVFNHFTDAVAFFPLLMLAFDKLMEVDDKKNLKKNILSGKPLIMFALSVMVCSIINYYFFFGQVIFLILYFFVRYVKNNPKQNVIRMFFRAAFGGIIGVMLAGLFLMLAFGGVAGNSRLSNYLLGYDMVVYPSAKMYWDILKSMVMLPDIIGRGTLFYTATVKNASLAIYLPMFGLAGVIGYFRMNKGKKDWKKSMLLISLFISFIPVLNSMFSLFNSEYYARWFYMPILLMSLATVEILETEVNGQNLRIGTLATILLFLLMIIIAVLPSRDDDGNIAYMSMLINKDMFWRDVLGTAVFYAVLILIVFLTRRRFWRLLWSYLGIVGAGVFGTMIVLWNGSSLISDYGMKMWQIQMLDTKPLIDNSSFCRVETDSTSTNYEMCWGIPTVHCFLSTVNSQIFDFYKKAAGITRTVESDSPLDRVGLRALLSCRYYIENTDINTDGEFGKDEGTMDYFEAGENATQNGFTLYENSNYIPMGFTFDYYTKESSWELVNASEADKYLVKTIILPDDKVNELKKQGFLSLQELSSLDIETGMDVVEFRNNCYSRRKTACTDFKTTKDGFKATTADFTTKELVFFSVPNVPGMKAYVDGKETEIITADYGLMAIPVESGIHDITVRYFPAYLKTGAYISASGICLVIMYFIVFKSQRKKGDWVDEQNDDEPEDSGKTCGA
ncbi:YfhO family protein [Butyrivibrio sp. NC3005]|uniref:YfhO family protein n=1 Tax=Butyrivibrio sp. NC3005 TaxID=1280685 RepID=UPI0003F9C162|nr:YfhO family protein [Butyrivibrio sp. NC3005]